MSMVLVCCGRIVAVLGISVNDVIGARVGVGVLWKGREKEELLSWKMITRYPMPANKNEKIIKKVRIVLAISR